LLLFLDTNAGDASDLQLLWRDFPFDFAMSGGVGGSELDFLLEVDRVLESGDVDFEGLLLGILKGLLDVLCCSIVVLPPAVATTTVIPFDPSDSLSCFSLLYCDCLFNRL
jgi:hypothetical protein